MSAAGRVGAPAKYKDLAVVRYIKRGLTVTPPRHRPEHGRPRQKLYSKYRLHTGAAQVASIRFHDGTILSMNERTDAVLRSPSVTYVQSGEVDQKLQPGSNHEIQTATAVAAAIGTEMDIKVEPCQTAGCTGPTTVVKVIEGAVKVSNLQGSTVVTTHEQTSVSAGQAPPPPQQVTTSQQPVWQKTVPPPAKPVGGNAALAANGGRIAGFSSEAPSSDGRWAATKLIDGDPATGWFAQEPPENHPWVQVGFSGGRTHTINAVVLACKAAPGVDTSDIIKEFGILTSSTGTDPTSFTAVMKGTCPQNAAHLQRYDFPAPVVAKYVELTVLSNYGGSDGVTFTELEAVTPDPLTP